LYYELPLALASGEDFKKTSGFIQNSEKKSIILIALAEMRLKPKGKFKK
jgi:hypothetical protein